MCCVSFQQQKKTSLSTYWFNPFLFFTIRFFFHPLSSIYIIRFHFLDTELFAMWYCDLTNFFFFIFLLAYCGSISLDYILSLIHPIFSLSLSCLLCLIWWLIIIYAFCNCHGLLYWCIIIQKCSFHFYKWFGNHIFL